LVLIAIWQDSLDLQDFANTPQTFVVIDTQHCKGATRNSQGFLNVGCGFQVAQNRFNVVWVSIWR